MTNSSSMEQLIDEYEQSIKTLEKSIYKCQKELENALGQMRMDLRKKIKIYQSMIDDLKDSIFDMKEYLYGD